jgi:hypothetical protein
MADTNRTQISGRVDSSSCEGQSQSDFDFGLALRDRIADVVEQTICGHWVNGFGVTVAEAVIAALQLTEDGGVIVGCVHD